MQRMPDLSGMKNEVVVPRYARNVYDHAVRMTGVKMVEVDTTQQFESALGQKTAMVMIMSGPRAEEESFRFRMPVPSRAAKEFRSLSTRLPRNSRSLTSICGMEPI